MKIEISDLMKSVLLRVLNDEINNQFNWYIQDISNGFLNNDTRLEIMKECHKLIYEIKMDDKQK